MGNTQFGQKGNSNYICQKFYINFSLFSWLIVDDIEKFKSNTGYKPEEVKFRIIGRSDGCLAPKATKSKREVILNDEEGNGKWRTLSSIGLWEEMEEQPIFQCLNL